MAIEFVRDELDKKREGLLETPGRPGFHQRWVRTSGYQPQAHLARMQRLGYERVEAKAEQVMTELAQKKRGRPKQIDRTVVNGDVILMECPQEAYEARRREQQALTQRHIGSATQRARSMGATEETVDTVRREE